ncbi:MULTISPECIES: flagellar assembly protein FliH [Helicobacter]|uniref:flagellar assembly protein FliH n=1 Tax=Helicobacter TaxID=209 RepID=UPI000DCB3257|nr:MULTISPECIES: flagellar assembly protein FliH [Helicobacter]MCI2236107.1 flagellar assembly protein FliH [Helicobacter sp. CaF467b]MCI7046670.1 flagellar assembly protein FliH [Helicobacter sp.]MCL9820303.1 FliH/SctL family protein [Helicobacter colisuis]MCL9822328.1 FliH/SctL family protein [Helicobacter colisuis]RAX53454.1 flagellar assembly protein FliH [Helicobacter sp. 11-8110]
MNNINEHKNIITEERKSKHDIQKYSFRNMEVAKKQQTLDTKKDFAQKEPEPTISQTSPISQDLSEEQIQEVQKIEEIPVQVAPSLKLFETEVVDKILQKSDVLAQSLQKLQEQFDKQEKEISQKVIEAKAEAKEQGFNEGYQKAKQELEAQINSQKELYSLSIKRIDEHISNAKNHIINLEKELSSIALDIAKEVITNEVNTNSAKIATSLARNLLQNLAENTQVTLKVFPGDLEELKETLQDLNNVSIQGDPAIAKGGVIILSNEGNIDGDIYMRFEALKKSILESRF